jgi:arylsulfatase
MKKRPNFLILFADQQRYDTICAAGYKHMKTPNFDRLANEGCVFQNAYSPNPVCMPARHYMMTGQSARLHGYYGNSESPIKDEGIPTIPQALSDNGYNTVAIGKMHFYPPRRHHGFDEMHLMEEIPHSRLDDAYLQYLEEKGLGDIRNIHGVRPALYHTPQKSLMPEPDHGVNWVADKSIDWLEKNGDDPFFLICGWIKPHPPWNVPDEWEGLYKNANLPDPLPFSREFPFVSEESDCFGDNDPDDMKREIREAYYTSISMVDAAVGHVLDCLERKGILDDTFIIYTSDHGEMLQDKGFYSKGLAYESSAHIPFIVRYPENFQAGSKDERFVDLMDLFPTIIEAAGIDYNYKESNLNYPLAGISFLDKGNSRDYQFADYATGASRWVMTRDKRYKYIYYYNGGTELFFDMKNDPSELNNLVKSSSVPQKDFDRLKKVCLEYEKERGPEECVKNDDFVALPPEKLNPGWDCSKFPLWANFQFQRFGKENPEKEAAIFLQELQQALKCNPTTMRKYMIEEPVWLEELRKNFKSIGGKDEDLTELLFSGDTSAV